MDIEEIIKARCRNKKTDTYEKALRTSYEKYKHLIDKTEIENELEQARIRYDEGYSLYDELADIIILCQMLNER